MNSITQPPLKVISSTHRTTINQLGGFVGNIARQLQAEAVRLGLLISGPQYWIYYGMDGKPDTEFTLEIALPVQGDTTGAAAEVKELPPFRSLVHLHEGAWENMPQSYANLMSHISEHSLQLSGVFREAYLNVDFAQPEYNRVEIQAGIL